MSVLEAGKVQEHLDELKRFWRHEALTLAKVRKATGYTEWPVPQYQRDLVFLSYKAGVTSIDEQFKSATALLGLPALPLSQTSTLRQDPLRTRVLPAEN